jgi:hypothetical protein
MKVAILFRSVAPLALTLAMYLGMSGNAYGKELSTTTAGWENVKLKCNGGIMSILQCTLTGEVVFHLVDQQGHPWANADVRVVFPQEDNVADHPKTELQVVQINESNALPTRLSSDENGDVRIQFGSHFFPSEGWDNNWAVLIMKVAKRLPALLLNENRVKVARFDEQLVADQQIDARLELSKNSFKIVVTGSQSPVNSRSNTQILSFVNADRHIAQLQAKTNQLQAEKVAKLVEDAKPIPVIPDTQAKDRYKNKLFRFLNATEEDVANAFMNQPTVIDGKDGYDRVFIYGAESPLYVSDLIYTNDAIHFYFKNGKCKQVVQVFAGNSANRERYSEWALVLPRSLEKLAIVDHKLSQGSNMVLYCNFPSDEWTIRAYAKPAFNQRSKQYDGFTNAHIFEVMIKSLK